ncbi:MAG: EAL domain-containing protein, partial [Spirulinaceae cyanobacterium]
VEVVAKALPQLNTDTSLFVNSNNSYFSLLKSLPDLVFINSRDGTYLNYHANCQEDFFVSCQELVGKKISEVLPVKMAKEIMNQIEQVFQSGKTQIFEYQLSIKRQTKYFEARVFLIAEDQVLSIIRNITERKEAEIALQQSEERYRLLAENATDMISRHQPSGAYVYASPACQSLLGYEPEELINTDAYDLFHPDDIKNIRRSHKTILKNLVTDTVSYRMRHKAGHYIWLESKSKAVQNSLGKVKEIIAVSREITERKRVENALRETEAKYRNIFENITQGIFQTTPEGRYISANPALANILGYDSPDELITSINDIAQQIYVEPQQRYKLSQLVEKYGSVSGYEYQAYKRDRKKIWVAENVREVRNKAGKLLCYEGSLEDITSRRLTEEKLVYQAFHDSLTGLPNRAWFIKHLEKVMQQASQKEDCNYAVLFIDLDRFKLVNDSFGHLVGDDLIKRVVFRLQDCLQAEDILARLGGDEFAILLEGKIRVEHSIFVAKKIEEQLKHPFLLEGHEVFATASIGITYSNIGYRKAIDLLRDVDTAMYHAKAQGKARYSVFKPAMKTGAMARLKLENDLRHALRRKEFHLYYQPIVSLTNGCLHGFESLLRWQHPSGQWISPHKIIPVAEETGLINPLGLWIFREACYQLVEWQNKFTPAFPLVINVNISGVQLKQIDLVEQMASILQETGADGSFIKLEITESCFLETISFAASMVKELKNLGIKICIDDFGTGYSSLSRLHEFPIDTLKIDRSFVSRLSLNSSHTAIVQTIVTLAHSLGMDVVAEGIETDAQKEKLRQLSCNFGQGYLFAKAVDRETASQMVDSCISC